MIRTSRSWTSIKTWGAKGRAVRWIRNPFPFITIITKIAVTIIAVGEFLAVAEAVARASGRWWR